MSSNLQMIGSWKKEVQIPLGQALAVTHELCGRNLAEACRHAIILLAKSAGRLTPQAPKLRKIVKNPDQSAVTDRRKAPYGVMRYDKNGNQYFKPIYRTGEFGKIRFFSKKAFSFFERDAGDPKGKWRKIASGPDPANPEIVAPGIMTDKRRIIGRRGLARQSWMWPLPELIGGVNKSLRIPGVSTLTKILTKTEGGFVLKNTVRYLLKIMPAGWEMSVQQAAANKIMKQAQMKLERRWQSRMAQGGFRGGDRQPDLGKYMRVA